MTSRWPFLTLCVSLIALTGSALACGRKIVDGHRHSFQSEASPELKADTPSFSFGVFPLHDPIRMAELYEPLTDFINRRDLGFRMRFEAAPNYGEHEMRVANKKYDFAIVNPYQAITAQSLGYRIFAKLNSDHKFSGVLIVKRGSKIRSFSDLRGKSICLVSPTALAGTMMVRMALKEKGLDILKDMKVRYVNSLDSAVLNVASGDSDVGGTSYFNYEAIIAARPELKDRVEVFWNTPTLPNLALVVSDSVPAHVVEALSEVFVGMRDNPELAGILRAMRVSGIIPANPATYDPVQKFLVRYKNLFAELPLPYRSMQ